MFGCAGFFFLLIFPFQKMKVFRSIFDRFRSAVVGVVPESFDVCDGCFLCIPGPEDGRFLPFCPQFRMSVQLVSCRRPCKLFAPCPRLFLLKVVWRVVRFLSYACCHGLSPPRHLLPAALPLRRVLPQWSFCALSGVCLSALGPCFASFVSVILVVLSF